MNREDPSATRPVGGARSEDDDPLAVSVIVPVFNAEKVLGQQLDALASQTYAGVWELIIADNGSSDGSVAVAERHRSLLPQLRIVDAAAKRGPSHARNIGAAEARGNLLLFCDADDVVSSGWVEAMVLAASTADLMAGSGEESRAPTRLRTEAIPEQETPKRFRFLPWNRSSNLGVSRTFFDEVGGFDEGRQIGEDVDFCWRIQLAGGRFAYVYQAYVAYRDRADWRSALRRQFIFGRAAPQLYADFVSHGAPRPAWRWTLVDLGRLILRAPIELARGEGGRWLQQVAGALGRIVGMADLRGQR